MKKIIMIGGTSFSGSTMFNLMLANIDGGLACGEVYALFRPRRKHHLFPTCGCFEKKCNKWHNIQKHGERNAYEAMFETFAPLNTIVDSSKNPLWYCDQHKYLQNNSSFQIYNILLWKTPIEFAYSIWKRGKYIEMQDLWRMYHRQYLAFTNGDFFAVKYKDLVMNPEETLSKLCDQIGLPYTPGMSQYWHREQHILFGSETARLHLHSRQTQGFVEMSENLSTNRPNVIDRNLTEVNQHQSIYYDDGYLTELPENVREEVAEDLVSTKIEKILEQLDIYNNETNRVDLLSQIKQVKASPTWYFADKLAHIFSMYRRTWFNRELR